MAVFWNIAACSLVDIDRRFRGAYCFRYNLSEDSDLHTPRHENLKPHLHRTCFISHYAIYVTCNVLVCDAA
jgi:hypothetical protein